ncbi:hypothetical protein IJU97_01015 [bacterium]|nr:hypothetical protein [bacterium]
MEDIFEVCSLDDEAVFHISNKKLIKAFLSTITNNDEEQSKKISNLIDKVHKI